MLIFGFFRFILAVCVALPQSTGSFKPGRNALRDKKRIGWIGTGIMGLAMAGHILDAGYHLTVHNRTKSRCAPLLVKGAIWADTPAEVARASDIVFSIVGYPGDVQEITLGPNGTLAALREGGIICDMTTSRPVLAREIASQAASRGCFALDAPVTGGDAGARNGELSIFAGGDQSAFRQVKPIFECFGKSILYCGEAGSGQLAKLANQISVAGIMFSVCESMLFAREAGLDVGKWLEFVSVGVAQSITMKKRGERILRGDFSPGFYVEYFVKDLGLCLEECRRVNLVLPGTELAEELYRGIMARGGGRDGTQVLIAALAELSGKKWRS